jgi:hypothetical protein
VGRLLGAWPRSGLCVRHREGVGETDSAAEETGFSLSVPRDTTKVARPPDSASTDFPREIVGAKVTNTGEDAGRLSRDCEFESGSLQRGERILNG